MDAARVGWCRICGGVAIHVGFAVGQDDTHFYVLGGNQSDAVTVARIAKSRFLGARWPATVPIRPQRLPSMQPGAFLATTNEI